MMRNIFKSGFLLVFGILNGAVEFLMDNQVTSYKYNMTRTFPIISGADG